MYQSNHLPMTSQQSRRKSQVTSNNMLNNQNQIVDPLQQMNFHSMGMGLHVGFGGMSDTGAAPDSNGSMMNMLNMHPMQIY